jgi:hypothetical protein
MMTRSDAPYRPHKCSHHTITATSYTCTGAPYTSPALSRFLSLCLSPSEDPPASHHHHRSSTTRATLLASYHLIHHTWPKQ